MIAKYFRLIWTEPNFTLRLGLVLVIVGVMFLQYQTLAAQGQMLSQINEKHQFLKMMEERRQVLLAKLRDVPKMVPLPAKRYSLEGSSLQKGVYQAVINGKVYKQGDPIDDFIVGNITMRSAVLVNITSGSQKTLQFTGPTQ